MTKAMEYGEKLELMRSEVRRLLKEYEDSEVGWWEMASDVHLDPRLDLEAQVNVYAQVSLQIDGDTIERHEHEDINDDYLIETYGVDMGVRTMRSFNEIGSFPKCSSAVNNAYQTYASLYLDCADDNLGHFLGRGIDTRPLDNYDGELTEEIIEKLYLDDAAGIAKEAMSEEFPKEYFLEHYPLLKGLI